MDNFVNILRKHKLRPTKQRVNLGSILFGKGDRHITAEILKKEGIEVNIASVPCIEALEQNKKRYDSIFDSDISIAIECSHPSSWYKHTKRVIGIDAYGESGAGNDLLSHFGFTAAKIAQRIKEIL